jgi:hypothetical protein
MRRKWTSRSVKIKVRSVKIISCFYEEEVGIKGSEDQGQDFLFIGSREPYTVIAGPLKVVG